MTTARQIIEDTLSVHLNRLSPGESADADTLAVCLRALNNVTDEWNGTKSFLFRTQLTASVAPVSTVTGTLGTTWTGIAPGDRILGATYATGGSDYPLSQLTMAQYHEQVVMKTESSEPEFFAHDGLATVYFYPVPNSKTITLRTHTAVAEFTEVDTDYSMPAGYRAALSACLAEALAMVMLGSIPQSVAMKAQAARSHIAAQTMDPAIIGLPPRRGNIITGY